jgi:hypothetical protein
MDVIQITIENKILFCCLLLIIGFDRKGIGIIGILGILNILFKSVIDYWYEIYGMLM